ncbi:carbohydrate ABC transporter permease [Paenibacillus doosanensis]|uniref:L-arabinose transport system permease protein AraQ n=1 Tax=Paenibacillus konkukensis TaxID=2020716 RepID=A0ABY4RNY7_9BACL|nr:MULTISPECIES: carbohydrate ABC transporter permease [Paenibacillus]MCS7461409.1 carbohydrate ABC transporter permease [Paenibacillus doosanensis]UQZ83680.1 L-arabinose transport system permease protein AraQ [Paenibacillus konkukensis]
MNRQATLASRLLDGVIIVLLLALVFVTLYPIYYIFIVSISDGSAVNRGDVKWIPHDVTIEAYKIIFKNKDIWHAYGNTLRYTVIGTAINVVFSAMCAFALSRKDMYGRNAFIFMIAFTMFLSGGMIPTYLVIQKLGLIDTMWAIVLPPAINTFNMIIMKTFFEGIPVSLQESAFLDGANDIQILLRIILPLSMPIMATMVLFYAVHHWNSFFPSLLYLNSKDMYPVQVLLRNIVIAGEFADQQGDIGSAGSSFRVVAANYKYAVIIITIIPILAVYPYLQKYFAKGVMIGALKG